MQKHNQPISSTPTTRGHPDMNRRPFLTTVAAVSGAALGGTIFGAAAQSTGAAEGPSGADSAVKALYESLSEQQKKAMCFDWDKKGYGGLPLRLHVTNNWAVSNTT